MYPCIIWGHWDQQSFSLGMNSDKHMLFMPLYEKQSSLQHWMIIWQRQITPIVKTFIFLSLMASAIPCILGRPLSEGFSQLQDCIYSSKTLLVFSFVVANTPKYLERFILFSVCVYMCVISEVWGLLFQSDLVTICYRRTECWCPDTTGGWSDGSCLPALPQGTLLPCLYHRGHSCAELAGGCSGWLELVRIS